MKKKILSFLLLTILCIGLFPISVSAESVTASGKCGEAVNWYYYKDSGLLAIVGSFGMYNYSSSNRPPWYKYKDNIKKIEVQTVSSIGDYAFADMEKVTSVTLPSTLTTIGERAFYNFSGIKKISLPENVASIGKEAFRQCNDLGTITLSSNLTSIGEGAFSYCIKLSSIKIPDGVTSIPDFAFHKCSKLEEITLSKNLTSIGNYAFFDCRVLGSINIPDGVTSICDYAFSYCNLLKKVQLPKNLKSIGSGAFRECLFLHELTIPDGLTEIKDYAFDTCISLQSINIPKTVTKIGRYAFTECLTFGDIYYEGAKEDWKKISIDSMAATVHYALPIYTAEPTASVAEGNYDSAQTVTLNCSTADATIYYTTDNTIPTSKSTKYTGSIKITESTTLKAIAVKSGNADSSVMTYHYIIKAPASSVTVSTNQNMSVIHSVNPDYTVTIPIETQIGKSAVVSASGVKINKGKTLKVKISATSGNNNAYTLKSAEGAVITYSVKENGSDVVVGTPFLSVSADNSAGSATLDFALVGEQKYAGNYTGTVTFTVSVE